MGYNKWRHYKLLLKKLGLGFFCKKTILKFMPWAMKYKKTVRRLIGDSCDRAVMRYLEKYLPIIGQYDFQGSNEQIGSTSNIWMLWWQGYENAPDIVKTCIASVRKNAGNHPVVLLDQYSYKQYITLPDHIIDSFEKGHMMYAHFSDVIRTSLLYQYGGIWMDATIYMLHPLDEIVEKSTFYSIRSLDDETDSFALRLFYWNTFFMACGRGNHILGLVNKLLIEYWKDEETFIDYLLLDFFLTMIYRNVEPAKRTMDEIPPSNRSVFELGLMLNKSRDNLKRLPDDGTYLYKLTHHGSFSDSVNGKETVYHMLVHEGWDGSGRSGSDINIQI